MLVLGLVLVLAEMMPLVIRVPSQSGILALSLMQIS